MRFVVKPPDPIQAGKSLVSRIRVNAADLAIRLGKDQYFRSKRRNFTFGGEDVIAYSKLGTPIFTNLIFGDDTNLDKNSYYDLDGTEVDFRPLRIDSVIMTVRQSKSIIKTSLQGKKGTIKEYVSSGDYIINVDGIIDNTINEYPEEEVATLIEIANIPDQIKVTSKFLQMFGIDYVVVEDFELGEKTGYRDVQEFRITMSSDVPPEEEI
jgi:hypothetical protein